MTDEKSRAAYQVVLEAEIAEIDAEAAKLLPRKKFANQLAEKAGLPLPYADVDNPSTAAPASLVVKADAFANHYSPSAAARAYLDWRGKDKGAASLDDIFDALTRGGFAFTSSKNDPKGGLRIALGKDSQVRRLPNGSYGLWDWYPNAKKDRKVGASDAADDADEEAAVTEGEPEDKSNS